MLATGRGLPGPRLWAPLALLGLLMNVVGNGFLTLNQGVNDQLNGQVTVRQIACSSTGSTLPPLGGGSGSSGPLLPAALVLLGAGAGLLIVRRRGQKLEADAV